MSGKLQIQFAHDMPGAAVEVLSPTLDTVGRVWLEPGKSAAVEVPSEASFLRVHLPSGQSVTLHDPGNLKREVSLASIRSPTEPRTATRTTGRRPRQNMAQLRNARQEQARATAPPPSAVPAAGPCQLADGTLVSLTANGVNAMAGSVDADAQEAVLHPTLPAHAYDLSVATSGGELRVRIPGRARQIRVTSDELGDDQRVLSVRVRTEHDLADTLGGYMARGDLHSAASMTSWIDGAEDMLLHKLQDPCAAAVGAYLLLRLRRFELMRSWARNLADNWPDLADGSVIWAWQQVHQRGSESAIRQYLGRAAGTSLPVFTEGLKLLGDGLRLTEGSGGPGLQKLNAAGLVLWDSPFTAHVPGTQSASGPRWRFDVGYAPLV